MSDKKETENQIRKDAEKEMDPRADRYCCINTVFQQTGYAGNGLFKWIYTMANYLNWVV